MEVVRRLVEQHQTTEMVETALISAVYRDRVNIVRMIVRTFHLLLNDEQFSMAMRCSCRHGYTEMVDVLIPHCDPGDAIPIYLAIRENHPEIVKRLGSRMDVHAQKDAMFRVAMELGHGEVVQVLKTFGIIPHPSTMT